MTDLGPPEESVWENSVYVIGLEVQVPKGGNLCHRSGYCLELAVSERKVGEAGPHFALWDDPQSSPSSSSSTDSRDGHLKHPLIQILDIGVGDTHAVNLIGPGGRVGSHCPCTGQVTQAQTFSNIFSLLSTDGFHSGHPWQWGP